MSDYADELKKLLDGGASKIDAAYGIIAKMILDKRFASGEVLSERVLSEQLGISRTPIRAALNRLTYEGYADMKADAYTIVAELGIRDIMELYELREALEGMAAGLFAARKTPQEEQELALCLKRHKSAVAKGDDEAARGCDVETHLLIARGSKNARLGTELERYIALSLHGVEVASSYIARYDMSLPQHERIVERIIAGDSQGAALAMREHLSDSREFFKKKCLFE